MIFLADIPELTIVGVADRGIPNQERVVIRINQDVDLAQFQMFLVVYQEGVSTPVNDYSFWLTDVSVKSGMYIFLYTGVGEVKFTTVQGTNEPAYVLHWGQPQAILTDPKFRPAIVRLSGLEVLTEHENLLPS